MKKVFIVALLVVLVGTTTFEATVKPVNYPAKHEFSKLSKVIDRISTDRFDEVVYDVHGKVVKNFYSKDGDYLGTTKMFAFDKLPKKALSVLLTKYSYPKYELQECIEFRNADNDINYYTSFKKNNKKIVLEISQRGNVSFYDIV